MGPRPGVEPGVAEPQSTVLTTRPPQPRCKTATCARYFKQAQRYVTCYAHARAGEGFKGLLDSRSICTPAAFRFCWFSCSPFLLYHFLSMATQSFVQKPWSCCLKVLSTMPLNGLYPPTRPTVRMRPSIRLQWLLTVACLLPTTGQ